MATAGTICALLCIGAFVSTDASVLHSLIKRADPPCVDGPICAQVTEICNGPDQDLVKRLCPVKCGGCDPNAGDPFPDCKDSTKINCTDVQTDVCTIDLGYSVCPRTCGFCAQNPETYPCEDQVFDISCADLPNPCTNSLGMIACARFCGICPATAQRTTTTTPAPTPTTTTTTTTKPTTTTTATTTTKPTTTKAPTTQTNNACDTAPCLNSGTCRSLAGGAFECTCPSSFGGPFCERDLRTTTVAPTTTPVPVTTKAPAATNAPGGICGNNPCLNGGTCKPTADGFSCTCTAGFTGRFCLDIVTTEGPTTTTTSSPTTKTPTTTTPPTTTAPPAPTSSTPIPDPLGLCVNNPCLNGGTCRPTDNGQHFQCLCASGFSGHYCLQSVSTSTPAGTCNFNPCLNGGTCLNNTGAISCVCPSGFTGGSCADRATTSNPGTTSAPVSSSTSSPNTPIPDPTGICRNNPCLNGGTCQPTSGGGFNCLCPYGYSGRFCLDIDTTATTTPSPKGCAAKPCLNGGTCRDTVGGGFTCQCPSGFGSMFCLPDATTAVPVTDASGCALLDKEQLVSGNAPAEIIFMVESSRVDSACDIDNEGDFIKNWIDAHNVDQDKNIRVGIVFYSADVNAEVKVTEYQGSKQGVKDKLTEFTGTCDPFQPGTVKGQGTSDLATAFDHVRQELAKSARPGVARVVVPIMHQMQQPQARLDEIPKAAQRLKSEACTSIVGIAIEHSSIDVNIVTQTVSEPYGNHLFTKESFDRLEYSPLSCNLGLVTEGSIGCDPAEVVFLVEYGRTDTQSDVDHEGDFIKALVDRWQVDDSHIRIGVVAYHDTVQEAIHIDEYKNDNQGLKDKISAVTGTSRRPGTLGRPSGDADLGKALDFVRDNSFKNARPGVPQVVIPIVHRLTGSNDAHLAASQKLKDMCVSVIAFRVGNRDNQGFSDTIHALVSQRYGRYNYYYKYLDDFNDLENWNNRFGTDGSTCSSRK